MGTESFDVSVRGLVRQLLQELDVAGVCVDEIRLALREEEHARAAQAAMSLCLSWARAQRAIRSLERVAGGGASESFARDALRASYDAGAPLVSEVLTRFADSSTRHEAATSAVTVLGRTGGSRA